MHNSRAVGEQTGAQTGTAGRVPTLILLVISGLSMVVILTQEGGEEGL